jgi:hypothetical protein
MWILLIERYWFYWAQLPDLRKQLYEDWLQQGANLGPSLIYRRIETLANDLKTEASRNMLPLQALVAILPLLGLLGTVSGMIKATSSRRKNVIKKPMRPTCSFPGVICAPSCISRNGKVLPTKKMGSAT